MEKTSIRTPRYEVGGLFDADKVQVFIITEVVPFKTSFSYLLYSPLMNKYFKFSEHFLYHSCTKKQFSWKYHGIQ